MSRTYAVSILIVLIGVLIESAPHTASKTEYKKEKAYNGQHEELQDSIRNNYFHKPGGSFFFTNVGPNSFEYHGMFQPGENPVNFISDFTSFFNDFPEYSKLPSFEDLFSSKKQLSRATTTSPKNKSSQYTFNPSLTTTRPHVIINDVSQFPNSNVNVRYLKNNHILKVNKYEFENNSSVKERFKNRPFKNVKSRQKFNKSNSQERKKIKKELQRERPKSPYSSLQEPTYEIQRSKVTTPPSNLYNFEILKSKALGADRSDHVLPRRGFFSTYKGDVYDIFRSKARVKTYPKIFRFNDYRVNIVEFDRNKKNGNIDDLSKGDALDPANVPRKHFLILHGGVYDDDRISRKRFGVNQIPFKSERQDFYDIYADDDEFENDDSFF
ncbi:uncharacterized protein LOC143237057 [Tachypleus tridentatus]|uniref:uncharacterized protein LOC143237057 n=1 Tax=Tachypleus tridentatus TaxID=6853 RepID=UPI003FD678E0